MPASVVSLESLQEAYLRLDRSLRFTFANKAAKAFLATDDFIGRTPWEVRPESADTTLESELRRALTEAKVVSFVNHYERWGRWHGITAMPDGESGLIVHFSDITDRMNLEAASRADRARLQRILETSDAGYFRIGLDGCYQDVNQAWLKMHGLTEPSQVIGEHFARYQTHEDLPKAAEIADLLGRGEAASGEFSRLLADGSIGYHSFSANPVFVGQSVVAFEGFLIDTTRLHLAEQERRQSEFQYRALFNGMQEGVAVQQLIDSGNGAHDYRILDVNRRYQEILGLDRDRVVNRLATEVYGTPTAPYLAEFASAVSSSCAKHFETYFPPLDRYFVISVAPLGGSLFATIFFDVTEQKQAQSRYQLISENSADVVWLWNVTEGRPIYTSPSLHRLLGVPTTNITPGPSDGVTLQNAIAELARLATESLAPHARGDSRMSDGAFRCADGRTIFTETQISVLASTQGPPETLVGVTRDVTERRQSADALWLAERRLERLLSNLPGIAYRCRNDRDWSMEFVSDGCMALTGYTANQLAGPGARPYNSLIPRDDQIRVWDEVQLALGKKQPFTLTYRIITADGFEKWVWEQGVGVFTPSGDLEALEGFIIDITDRLNAQRALEESERQYRELTESVPVGLYRSTLDGQIIFANRALCQMLGYPSQDEIRRIDIGRDCYVVPSQRQDFLLRLEERGYLSSEDLTLKRKDGTLLTALEYTRLVRHGPNGEPVCEGMLVDITEKKDADAALRREREFIDQAIDAIPGIFFVLDEEGHYVRWNRAQETLMEVPPAEIPRLDSLARLHADDREKVASKIDEIWRLGTGEVEARGYVGSGPETRDFLLTGRRLDIGESKYIVGCGIDISERKAAETARAEMEARLLQGHKLESIGRLAGGIAHDFNNLLTIINGYAAILLRRVDEGPVKDGLTEIAKAGDRAAELTGQLLAFARKNVIQPRHLDLNGVITDTTSLLKRLVGEGVEVTISLAEEPCHIMADPGQIGQILINLATNARDAMAGQGNLRIRTYAVALEKAHGGADTSLPDGRYVVLRVADSGSGMDGDTKQHLFEPFFTTKGPGSGTGLGLATVHGIVTRAGGEIRVESAIGRGTAFEIRFPATVAGDASTRDVAGSTDENLLGSETILVTEDNSDLRRFISQVLASLGYRVLEAADVEQALQVVQQHGNRIDLVITDVVMPGKTGLELVEEITRRGFRIRTLFMSGYTADRTILRGIATNGYAFLPKPFSPLVLATRVRQTLATTPGEAPGEAVR